MIEYFDAYLVGLAATPDNRTYGFFNKNVVSEYDHEKAVSDGVNVGNEIYVIETEKTKQGGTLTAKQQIEKRERLTRKNGGRFRMKTKPTPANNWTAISSTRIRSAP